MTLVYSYEIDREYLRRFIGLDRILARVVKVGRLIVSIRMERLFMRAVRIPDYNRYPHIFDTFSFISIILG